VDGLLPALSERRARRAFAADPPTATQLVLLWEAVVVAPSHGNTQATRILLPATLAQHEALGEALSSGNRSWALAAPVLCALAVIPALERPVIDSSGGSRDLSALHAGIVLGNLMTQATAMGIVAHPMAGFDEGLVRSVFAAPESVRVLAVVAIGFPGRTESLPEDLREREIAPQRRVPWQQLVVNGVWPTERPETAR